MALSPSHHAARGLGAEMQLMKAFVHVDSTELVCNVGRARCSRLWVEEGSFRAVFEARWPWHPVRACLADRSIVLLCSHLSFLSLFLSPSHPPSPHQLLLEEYANSDPKLALTGVPIVQWPKRDKVRAARRDRGGCCWRVPRAVWPVTCCAAGAQWCNLCASLGSLWAVEEHSRVQGSSASAALWAEPCACSCRGLQLRWCRGQPRLLCVL